MSKLTRQLIIAGVVLAVLGGGLAALLLWPEGAVTPSGPTETVPPIAYAKPINMALDDVLSIDYTAEKGNPYTITLRRGDDGDLKLSLSPRRTGFTYDEELLQASVRAAVTLEGCTLLRENVPDSELSNFGFDAPLISWTINTPDGVYALQLGSPSGGGDGVYIRAADSGDVYILPYASGMAFARAEYELRALRFLPDYQTSVAATEALNYFEINGAEAPFTIRRLTEQEAEENPLAAMYRFTAPISWYCDSFYLNKELLTPLFTVGFDAVVEDDPEDLAQYGLDAPYTVALKDKNGWQATLLIGRQHESGGRFVMQVGIDTVFIDRTGDYSFLSVNFDSMIHKLFWIHNIQDVSRVDYDFGNFRRTLTYNVTEGAFAGTYQGRPVGEDNGRRLYIRMLQTRVNSLLDADAVPGAYYGSMAITLRDGTVHKMELYSVTSRVYGVIFNGEDTRLTVHKSTIDELIELMEVIDSGGTIPM